MTDPSHYLNAVLAALAAWHEKLRKSLTDDSGQNENQKTLAEQSVSEISLGIGIAG